VTRTQRDGGRRRSVRIATIVGLVALSGLASAASADAALTRIRVDWSAQAPPGGPQSAWEFSPYLHIFTEGNETGWYTGPCAREGNCQADPGFHWEEANPNGGGYAQVISLVDDQPGRARQLCYEVQHPYAPDWPTDPRFSIVVTVTDPGGASRTRNFTLAKGQRSDVDCSPEFRPSQIPAVSTRPPAWFVAAKKLLKARGGKCERSSTRLPADDPITGRPKGTYTEVDVQCRHAIPKRLFVKFGGNPAAPNPSESCGSIVSKDKPDGDGYSYLCRIFSARRKNGKPTKSSWLCQRSSSYERTPGGRVFREAGRTWVARRTPRSQERKVKTLGRCLTRQPAP
jgi:hypothetical protein